MPTPPVTNRARSALAPWVLAGLVLAALALREAWVDEDTFITFRTIDNFVHGYGLRWNVDERVQSYTHPLWMLLCVPFYFVLRHVETTVTVVGLSCSAAALWVAGSRYRREPIVLLAGLLAPLALSGSYVLFATSGFENSLVHLCFAWFAVLFLRGDREVPWARLALAAAAGAFTRLDTALFFVPPLALLLLTRWREVRWGRLLAGFAPLAAWLLFSLVYYGFVFPNTKLAKLNEEIPLAATVRQGLFYVQDLLRRDPVGCAVIGAGVAATLFRGARWLLRREGADLRRCALGIGMILYGAYVIAIGGCYLSGRFWTTAILAAALLWCEELRELLPRLATRRGAVAAGAACGVLLAAFLLLRPLLLARTSPALIERRGRAHAYLEGFRWKLTDVASLYQRTGARERRLAERDGARRVSVALAVGRWGMAAGPDVTMIDRNALADPLLARLPSERTEILMVGHFPRALPDGYQQARRTGSLEHMHPALREYYRAIRTIVSAPLFSGERLATLAAFHLGRYDHFLAEYLADRRDDATSSSSK
jgi:arabinofuranosyltransferase